MRLVLYYAKLLLPLKCLQMKEKYEKIVHCKDVSEDAMETLVNFMYTEEITLTEENVSDILHAASMLRVVGKGTFRFFSVDFFQ